MPILKKVELGREKEHTLPSTTTTTTTTTTHMLSQVKDIDRAVKRFLKFDIFSVQKNDFFQYTRSHVAHRYDLTCVNGRFALFFEDHY